MLPTVKLHDTSPQGNLGEYGAAVCALVRGGAPHSGLVLISSRPPAAYHHHITTATAQNVTATTAQGTLIAFRSKECCRSTSFTAPPTLSSETQVTEALSRS
jgi:hypothetical protein